MAALRCVPRLLAQRSSPTACFNCKKEQEEERPLALVTGALNSKYAGIAVAAGLQRPLSTATETKPSATPLARELLAEFARDRFSFRARRDEKLRALFTSLETLGDVYLIEEALTYVKRSGLHLTPEHTAQILDACLKHPDDGLDMAMSVFGSPGNPAYPAMQLAPNTVARLMRALHDSDRHAEALDVFIAYDEIMSFPLSVYDEMFRTALAGEDLHHAAIHEFEYIREHGPMPDAKTYYTIIQTAMRQEEYEYALSILNLYESDRNKMGEAFSRLRQEAQQALERQNSHANS